MPIIAAPRNQMLVIDRITGNDDARRHLENLGLVPGADISIAPGTGDSGIICDVSGSRIALDRRSASHIHVSPA